MSRKLLVGSMMALALSTGFVATPAMADSADISFEKIWTMADMSKDGMVNKKEFMDAMSKAFDMKMEKMKTMKDSAKMMKGDAMTKEGFRSLLNDLHHGA